MSALQPPGANSAHKNAGRTKIKTTTSIPSGARTQLCRYLGNEPFAEKRQWKQIHLHNNEPILEASKTYYESKDKSCNDS